MELALLGLPVTVALAVVALLGFIVGRWQSAGAAGGTEATRRELKRAQAIIHDLEQIAQRVRRELGQHHGNLDAFKRRVNELSLQSDKADWRLLCEEAERLLRPTQDLAMQLAHAYDGIRQQSTRLMTFTGQRCDPLTGLCNRQMLDESLENYLTMHRRYGILFSVAVFDLDYFRLFNTSHGHPHGDRVLKQVASLLDQQARDTDIVTRAGGEEFIVVLPATELPGATTFAERIRQTVERGTSLTVSGGVATVIEGADAKPILPRVDSALYAAKAAGRNKIFCHTGSDVLPSQSQDLTAPAPAAKDKPAAPKSERPASPQLDKPAPKPA